MDKVVISKDMRIKHLKVENFIKEIHRKDDLVIGKKDKEQH